MRYRRLAKDVETLEDHYKRVAKPTLPDHPLRELPADQAIFILNVVFGLREAKETGDWNEYLNHILSSTISRYGVRKQPLFDLLEKRNGAIDQENRKWIVKLLSEKICEAEAEQLLEDLHIHLVRQVMDPGRPYLRAMAGDDGQRLLHEEFGVDVRFPSLLTKWGPTECRLNPDDEKNWPPQQELTERLKIAYDKNCIGWKEMVRQYTRNNFPKSKSVANSREYPNSKMRDNNIGL